MKTQLHTKSQDKKGESQSKAFEKSRVYVVHKKKTQNVHEKNLGTKCKIKRTKKKGKSNCCSTNFGIVMHGMWKNKGAYKQLHKNKNDIKSKKMKKQFMCMCHQKLKHIVDRSLNVATKFDA
jgi:hypothetical protein